ncbi:MAG: hypothetical protein R3F34_08200 [Planctomycetota bacterium]
MRALSAHCSTRASSQPSCRSSHDRSKVSTIVRGAARPGSKSNSSRNSAVATASSIERRQPSRSSTILSNGSSAPSPMSSLRASTASRATESRQTATRSARSSSGATRRTRASSSRKGVVASSLRSKRRHALRSSSVTPSRPAT